MNPKTKRINNRSDLDTLMANKGIQAENLLMEISELIHDMPAPDSDGLTWGHAGNMGHVVDQLREIRDFLGS